MKYAIILLILIHISIGTGIKSQTVQNYAVLVTTTINENPTYIRFDWVKDTLVDYYRIQRKKKTDINWQLVYYCYKDTIGFYTDTTVKVGEAYEYEIIKNCDTYVGVTYVYAGIKYPATDYRGKVLLLVDSNYSQPLKDKLERLKLGLIGDGWQVIRKDVGRNQKVTEVKNLIKNLCAKDTAINTLFLLGHIPVPYSGDINPDGHANHKGAWPADVYYGDFNAAWTDTQVNDVASANPANHNIQADGKFDQSKSINPTLKIGRVDLTHMPSFSSNDTALMANYLDKDHNFRMGLMNYKRRGLVYDNFGVFNGEAPAANGWRFFSAFFGAKNVVSSSSYFGDLSKEDYLWSYGCGPGSYTSCLGIGNSYQFVRNPVNTIFTTLFGSYYGDWDNTDNFLRAPLASNSCLVSFWGSRPKWFFHLMGLGETIGYCARLTQNCDPGAWMNSYTTYVHIDLMGDPTLRMHVVLPPSKVTFYKINSNQSYISWRHSSDTILGYYVYRTSDIDSSFQRINRTVITDTNFLDIAASEGNNVYMVRALKLELTGCGSYYNLSQGIIADNVTKAESYIKINDDIELYPNPSNTGSFFVRFSSLEFSSFAINVYDSYGRKVYLENFKSNSQKIILLNLINHSNGIYWIQVILEDGNSVSKKIIISR